MSEPVCQVREHRPRGTLPPSKKLLQLCSAQRGGGDGKPLPRGIEEGAHAVSFVSVTQQFNTTPSMGRLTLNMLLSFAQFEREVTGERIRDKIAASKKK